MSAFASSRRNGKISRKKRIAVAVSTTTATLVLLPAFLAAYCLGSRPVCETFHDLLLLLTLLMTFAVGVDMVHAAFIGSPRIELYLGVLEDGGELLAVSIFAWYAYLLTRLPAGSKAYFADMSVRPSRRDRTGRTERRSRILEGD